MRADRRRNVLSAARILGWTSRDGSTRPTRSRTAARMGVTERTVSKIWRTIEGLGYLSCVEPGTTAQYRPSWARAEGNLARCWVLTLPETSPRRGSQVEVGKSPRPGNPQPKRITDEGRRRESARFVRAGWSVRDLREATETKPDGTRWAFTGQPRHPRSWFRWRLSFWLGPDGPLDSPSQRRAAASVSLRAAQEARRRDRCPGTEPTRAWHHARAALSARDSVPPC